MASILATVGIAAMQSFSDCQVIERPWARAVVAMAVVGSLLLCSKKWTFAPEQGPTFIPTTVLHKSIPSGAVHALEIENAPATATAVIYWAVLPGVVESDSNKAFGKFENSGLVEVVGGRATLRVHCPGNLVQWGAAAPRTVFYRYVFEDGTLSETKAAPIKC